MSPAGRAEEYRFADGKIIVSDVWAGATDGQEGLMFMTIRNDGEDDKLTQVRLPFGFGEGLEIIAEDVKLIDYIPVPGDGAITELKPGSRYVMVLKLEKPLREGSEIPMRIFFWDARDYEIPVPIRVAPPRWAVKCRSESLFECGNENFDRELDRRQIGRAHV